MARTTHDKNQPVEPDAVATDPQDPDGADSAVVDAGPGHPEQAAPGDGAPVAESATESATESARERAVIEPTAIDPDASYVATEDLFILRARVNAAGDIVSGRRVERFGWADRVELVKPEPAEPAGQVERSGSEQVEPPATPAQP